MNIVEVLLLVAAVGTGAYRLGRWAIRRSEEKAAEERGNRLCGDCGGPVMGYDREAVKIGKWDGHLPQVQGGGATMLSLGPQR